jgi:heat shock protein 4
MCFVKGETATKSGYVSKLDALKSLGDPVALRYQEAERRPAAIRKMRETLSEFQAKASGNDDRYAHLEAVRFGYLDGPRSHSWQDDFQKAIERLAVEEKWLNDQSARQAERPKTEAPAFLSSDVAKRGEELT